MHTQLASLPISIAKNRNIGVQVSVQIKCPFRATHTDTANPRQTMQSAGHHALERKQQDEFVKQRERDEGQDLPEKCM